MFFHKREYAAHRLAQRLADRHFVDPLVLAIPRGGVVTGAVLAHELAAELDVALCPRLRLGGRGVGALGEDGCIYLDQGVRERHTDDELIEERRRHLATLARRRKIFREVRAQAPVEGRSVIVTDDGIATGSTMLAALQVIRAHGPRELIVAVPLAPPDRLAEVSRLCDEAICLHSPEQFWTVAEFYADFSQVQDEQAADLLRATLFRSRQRTPTARDVSREALAPPHEDEQVLRMQFGFDYPDAKYLEFIRLRA